MKLEVSNILKDHGVRSTKVREAVLRLLIDEGHPLSHSEMSTKKEISEFDRVTVYRTLEVLHEAHLIHQVKGTDGISRFGANLDQSSQKCTGDHIHFLCSDCHKMTCLPEQALPWIKAPKGFEIHSKQLVVHGKCSSCGKKSKGGTKK